MALFFAALDLLPHPDPQGSAADSTMEIRARGDRAGTTGRKHARRLRQRVGGLQPIEDDIAITGERPRRRLLAW